uniref:Uncharacterized protein n=1 Tax=Zea mays TaxID=4577 RepID=C0P9L9_MAIZE|nr:unknown [Zea mays]
MCRFPFDEERGRGPAARGGETKRLLLRHGRVELQDFDRATNGPGAPFGAPSSRDPANKLGDPVRAAQRGHPEGPSRHEGEPVGRGAAHHDAVDGLPVSGLGNLRACCLPWMW